MESMGLIDKSWINLDNFRDPRFIKGVEDFSSFAVEHHHNKNVIPCPCRKCRNQGPAMSHDDVMIHCFSHGFDKTYKFWFLHGEKERPEQLNESGSSFQANVPVVDMNAAFTILAEELSLDNLDAVLGEDPGGRTEGEELVEGVEFNDNLCEAMTELYPGCTDFSVLRFVVKLLNLKITNGLSDKAFTDLLQLLRMAMPSGNKIPENAYKADKMIKDLKLKCQKIDACRNDCILYWGDNEFEVSCPTCGVSRYKTATIEQLRTRTSRVPAKVLRYFPITDRLKRLYSVGWVAKEMRWHSTGASKPGTMRHPVDSAVWKQVDSKYPDFSAEPRNVRLGLATDGFNPFGTLGTQYSSWPVMCVTYNLPPWLCMKSQFTMLTTLIEGPKQPGNDIDVYLQPLVKELQDLWHDGAMVKDAFKGEVFKMRVILLWTIHDLPAYGNISGCKTKGRFACPACGPKTASLWLKHGKKHVYMRTRRWLPLTSKARHDTRESTYDKTKELDEQLIRLTGVEVKRMTKNLKIKFGKGKKRKDGEGDEQEGNEAASCFSKRSIFFRLKYWKHIVVRHILDVMHIEKNVCEILLAMMLNTKKTKDNAKARNDLKHMKIKKKYWVTQVNGKRVMPQGIFWLRKEERKLFIQTLQNLSVPAGFSGNWSNIVKGDCVDLKQMKSHDYHILMQHLLPVLIQHAYRDGNRKEARSIITTICTFFGALCSKKVEIETLNVLERGMIKALCALERICPPSLFVSMMHLPIHLAYEARQCGPVFCRWMYCFERYTTCFCFCFLFFNLLPLFLL